MVLELLQKFKKKCYLYIFRDCIKGVGWEILKRAYEILSRIEEDEVEVTRNVDNCYNYQSSLKVCLSH